ALVSEGLWRRALGGDPRAVGRTVLIDGVTTQVIGVMRQGFAFPALDTDLWQPLHTDSLRANLGGNLDYGMIGRLAAGANPARAAVDLNRLAGSLDRYERDPVVKILMDAGLAVRVRPLRDLLVGDISATLWLVFGAVGFILAIACANVANLLLVRG